MTETRRSALRRFLDTARRQFKRGCIPAATAVLVSRLLAWIEAPLIAVIALAGAGVAYFKGYRLRIHKPEPRKQPQPKSKPKPKSKPVTKTKPKTKTRKEKP